MKGSQYGWALVALAAANLQGGCDTDTAAAPRRHTVWGTFPKAITQHGEKWQDAELSETKGKGWREPILYVDGVPRAAFRGAEFPIRLKPTMIEKRRALDYNANDPGPHTAIYYAPRWNVAAYLAAVGVPLGRVKAVLFHGGRGAAYLDGAELRRHQAGIFFDLTDESKGFLRIYLPKTLRLNASYDRYVGISVFVDKPAPHVDDEDQPVLDGESVIGVPYYGQPLRGGIRIYVDDVVATVLKRNLLGQPGQAHPSLVALLATFGVDANSVDAADIILGYARTQRLSGDALRAAWFTTAEQASGTLMLNGDLPATALMLYTKARAGSLPSLEELNRRGLQRDTP